MVYVGSGYAVGSGASGGNVLLAFGTTTHLDSADRDRAGPSAQPHRVLSESVGHG